MTARTVLAVSAATASLTTAAALAGCASLTTTPTSSPDSTQQAAAYMATNPPAGHQPGMLAGVVLDSNPVAFAYAAATQAHCPSAKTTAVVRSQRGGERVSCGALTLTILTTSGRTVHAECGSITHRVACRPWLTGAGDQADDWMNPLPGDYVWFPASGQVRTGTDLRLITWQAIIILGAENGGSWVTSSASPPAVPVGAPEPVGSPAVASIHPIPTRP